MRTRRRRNVTGPTQGRRKGVRVVPHVSVVPGRGRAAPRDHSGGPVTSESPGASGDSTLGQIGEFGLINRVARRVAQGPAVLLGPGDDAAVVSASDGRVVASTDLLV